MEETLNTEGWKSIIGPSLDRMIAEEVGGKFGDTWIYGNIADSKSEKNVWFHVGAKQRLIELYNHIHNHTKMIGIIRNRIKDLEQDRKGEFAIPMMEVQYAEGNRVQRQKEAEKTKEEVANATKKGQVKKDGEPQHKKIDRRRSPSRSGGSNRPTKRRVQKSKEEVSKGVITNSDIKAAHSFKESRFGKLTKKTKTRKAKGKKKKA